jgi:hypothetical protein
VRAMGRSSGGDGLHEDGLAREDAPLFDCLALGCGIGFESLEVGAFPFGRRFPSMPRASISMASSRPREPGERPSHRSFSLLAFAVSSPAASRKPLRSSPAFLSSLSSTSRSFSTLARRSV